MIRFPSLERLGLAIAAFSEKNDGDCRYSEDNGAGVGRVRMCQTLGVDPGSLVGAHQVHGVRVVAVTEADRGRGAQERAAALPETDGLITNVPALPITILVADCVPVYLFDPTVRAGGILHAGRVGTYGNIAAQGVAVMTEAFGCRPGNLHAVIGPSAGPERYEVSPGMADEWRAAGLPARERFLDLWEANVRQLVEAGLPHNQVTVAGLCTISDSRFYSHRRDACGGRNMALLMI